MKQNLPSVAVMMAAYNGERYISEQIDSILAQTGVSVELFIRDDGSHDDTWGIISNYALNNQNVHIIKGQNVGCKNNFLELAKYVYIHASTDYYAFSDQDDIWLTNKLCSGINMLKGLDNNRPLLYICPTKMVDSHLNVIPVKNGNEFKYTRGESLMLGTCAGCTMVFNRRLLELFAKTNPEHMIVHDEWIYKICLFCNGIFVRDRNSYILYRQHSSNSIGSNQGFYKSWIRRINMFVNEPNIRSLQAKYILEDYYNDLSKDARPLLETVVYYRSSLKKKIKLITSPEFRTKRNLFNVLFIVAVAFNRY